MSVVDRTIKFWFHEVTRTQTVIQPKVLRYAILVTALILAGTPFVGLLYGCPLLRAISSYYHTGVHDLFVGVLFAIGIFLLSYRGTARFDNWTSTATCLSAIGVVVFPPDSAPYSKSVDSCWVQITPLIHAPPKVHVLSTVLFFLFMLVLVIRFGFEVLCNKDRQLKWRYWACAFVMLAGAMAFTVGYLGSFTGPVILVGEVVAILSFALAWLIKARHL